MSTSVLTRPLGNGSSLPGNTLTGVTVSPSDVVVVDSCPVIATSAVKWIYTCVDSTTNQVTTAEVLATHCDGSSSPSYTIYGVIGNSSLHRTSVVLSGGDIGLQIANLSNSVLTFNIVRIQVLA